MEMEVDKVVIACCVRNFLFIRDTVIETLYDSDEENEAVLEKNEHFAEVTVPNFNDRQFKEHFRMFPHTFEDFLIKIHNCNENLHDVRRGQLGLPLEKQLLITIWCLSNTECFRSVADRFGIAKSTCWRTLYNTCHLILEVNKKLKVISFPGREQSINIINGFENINGFPGVIGAIDGCHIQIDKPHEFPNSFINRKGYPSVLLQGVCDHRRLFLDVYAGEAGSIHNSRLFKKSDLYERIRSNEIEFPNDSHLVGDLAYTLSTKLMVGFKDNGHLTDQQKYFNRKLSQVRVAIENTFGILKGRFRRLKAMETQRLDLVSLLIVTACILHNMCITNNDLYEGILENNPVEVEEVQQENVNPAAQAKRNNIVNHLYELRPLRPEE